MVHVGNVMLKIKFHWSNQLHNSIFNILFWQNTIFFISFVLVYYLLMKENVKFSYRIKLKLLHAVPSC